MEKLIKSVFLSLSFSFVDELFDVRVCRVCALHTMLSPEATNHAFCSAMCVHKCNSIQTQEHTKTENALLFIQQNCTKCVCLCSRRSAAQAHHVAAQRTLHITFGIFPKLCTIKARCAREHLGQSFNFKRQNKLSTFNMHTQQWRTQQRHESTDIGSANEHPVHSRWKM